MKPSGVARLPQTCGKEGEACYARDSLILLLIINELADLGDEAQPGVYVKTPIFHAMPQTVCSDELFGLTSKGKNLRRTGRRKSHGAVYVSAVDRQEACSNRIHHSSRRLASISQIRPIHSEECLRQTLQPPNHCQRSIQIVQRVGELFIADP